MFVVQRAGPKTKHRARERERERRPRRYAMIVNPGRAGDRFGD